MTVFVMFLGSDESCHSILGPPHECSFTVLGSQWETAVCLTGVDWKEIHNDIEGGSCSVSGDSSNNLRATCKSLSLLAPIRRTENRFLTNSRTSANGDLIHLLSL